ncbi:hypothetical protein [Halorubellus litoreus]|uniref:Uncharacterized protein n=1 Tax=Halorubellus litoreus TaxID=755308 RepID=A0ABD5VNQ9_9EURY
MESSTRQLVTAHLLRHTLVAGAVLTFAIAAAGTELLGLGARNVLFFLAVFAGGLVLVPFAVSDAGLESAGVGVAGGFDVTNPSEYRAGTDGSLRLKAAFSLAGVLAYSLLGFAALTVA